jgi:glycosyltransferase involved in cell wall biosynthesis
MKSIAVLKIVYNQASLVKIVTSNINEYASPGVLTLIQDDCSDDGTYEEYVTRSPLYSRVWRTEKNVGPRANMSSLLEKCETDYVTFSGGDDLIHVETMKALSNFINSTSLDMVILKGLHVSEVDSYRFSRDPELNNKFPEKWFKNSQLFLNEPRSARNILAAAAVMPGLMWCQGLVIKTGLAKRAGFLDSTEIEDWGLQHNLAVIAKEEELSVGFLNRVLGIMIVRPNSTGSQVFKQLERQVSAIDRHWDPSFKKIALLNCVGKKIGQLRDNAFSYEEIKTGILFSLAEGFDLHNM